MQAQNYGKIITYENKDSEYMMWLKKCNENIDKLGITEYNVSGISKYAEQRFIRYRYDEVEAEYKSQIAIQGKKR